jgi:hypothetical protein
MFVLVENGAVKRYPYSPTDAVRDNPQISFPAKPSDSAMAAVGAMRVYFTTQPTPTQSEVVEEGAPVFSADSQRWEQQWIVRSKTPEELAAEAAALQSAIVEATQARLDDFARTRNYDGILSLCTYATSTVPKFQTEGQYGVEARDATWSKLYEVLAEVEAGTRPMPTGYADIEPELPVLAWPEQP